MNQEKSKEVIENLPTTKVKNRSSIGLIVIIIVLIFFLLFSLTTAGFLYYLYMKEKNQINDLSSKVTNLFSELDSLKKDKESLVSQNDLLKKENEFYKTNLINSNQQNTNPYDKTITHNTGNYMINGSDTRIISESEINNFTPWQLKVARNEIYARHGRSFVHKDLACYFANQEWYKINSNYSDSLLTSIENQNVSIILNYEKKINSPLMNYDSGC